MRNNNIDIAKHKVSLTSGVDRLRGLRSTFCFFLALVHSCFTPVWAASNHVKGLGSRPEVVWGHAAAGLRAGLVLPTTIATQTVSGMFTVAVRCAEPMELEIVIENIGKTGLQVPGSILYAWHWLITLTPMSGGTPIRAVLHPPPTPIAPPSPIGLPQGEQQRISITCAHWIAVGEEETYDKIRSVLPLGTYLVSGHYESTHWEVGPGLWQGAVTTGEAKLRIVSN